MTHKGPPCKGTTIGNRVVYTCLVQSTKHPFISALSHQCADQSWNKISCFWSSLKHMLWSVFWKSDSKIIGFSKLFMAKSALECFIHSDQIHLHWQAPLISELLFTALTDTADSLSFNTFAFFKNSIYGTKHFERKWLARSCFSNKAIICQLPCGHMTISPQPWGFRVVDTVKSLFLHSLIAIIGRLSLHTIFNSLWG